MLIFDFFAGTRSSTKAFEDAGHQVISFELDESFDGITEYVDIMELNAKNLFEKYGRPDFIWASPPCTAFSVASMGHHWQSGGASPVPKTKEAAFNQKIVAKTLQLINDLHPSRGWLMENPRGMLRKLEVVKGLPRITVTYCQYGDKRMKPTDLWGFVPGWTPRESCKKGMPCHEAAPRGSRTGTQGLKNAKIKSQIPYQLGLEILKTIEGVNK